jgi:hypothetical protein
MTVPYRLAASMLDSDLLNPAAYLHVFLVRYSFLQRTITSGSADTGQLTPESGQFPHS